MKLTDKISLSIFLFIFSLSSLPAADTGWSKDNIPQWQETASPQGIVKNGTIDTQWTPKTFVYQPGKSIRYIDYAQGNDNNSGVSPAQAWQHHPWDPAAKGFPAESQDKLWSIKIGTDFVPHAAWVVDRLYLMRK